MFLCGIGDGGGIDMAAIRHDCDFLLKPGTASVEPEDLPTFCRD